MVMVWRRVQLGCRKSHDIIRQKLFEWKLAIEEADIKSMAVSKPFSDLFDSLTWHRRLGKLMAVRRLTGNIMTARLLTYSSQKRHPRRRGVYGTTGLGLDAGRTVFDLVMKPVQKV